MFISFQNLEFLKSVFIFDLKFISFQSPNDIVDYFQQFYKCLHFIYKNAKNMFFVKIYIL